MALKKLSFQTAIHPASGEPSTLSELFTFYPELRNHLDPHEPLLALPLGIIRNLAGHARHLGYFRDHQQAEEALTRTVTWLYNAAGVFRGKYLLSHIVEGKWLTAGEGPLTEAEIGFRLVAGSRPGGGRALDLAEAYFSSQKQIQRAMAAALLSYPEFQEDVARLRKLWRRLPDEELDIHMGTKNPVTLRKSQVAKHRLVNTWRRQHNLFLEKYLLMEMPCFDLPEPVGRIELNKPLPKGCYALPGNCRSTYAHPCEELTDADQEIVEELRDTVLQPDRLLRRLHTAAQYRKQYDRLFEVMYIEKCVTQRCPGRQLPRGGVDDLVQALARYYRRSRDTIHRYRGAIAELRQGDEPTHMTGE